MNGRNEIPAGSFQSGIDFCLGGLQAETGKKGGSGPLIGQKSRFREGFGLGKANFSEFRLGEQIRIWSKQYIRSKRTPKFGPPLPRAQKKRAWGLGTVLYIYIPQATRNSTRGSLNHVGAMGGVKAPRPCAPRPPASARATRPPRAARLRQALLPLQHGQNSW